MGDIVMVVSYKRLWKLLVDTWIRETYISIVPVLHLKFKAVDVWVSPFFKPLSLETQSSKAVVVKFSCNTPT